MKCQKCDKYATFHITELTGEERVELHLCEDHAQQYLSETSEQHHLAGNSEESPSGEVSWKKIDENLQEVDQQVCPVCGISFFEFRKKGWLGCPFDYTCFEEHLGVLVENIHGERKHVGKIPKKAGAVPDRRIELIKLRREMDEAIAIEDYERAQTLKKKIHEIESD
ncbi:MAG: DNA helicase UvrBC [Planctomycetaceae bacterium]|nr:DNA helicase UvrBC [Planctomycetaceae bacterium]